MKTFASDNTSGVHPRFLEAMNRANIDHAQSYGMDRWTQEFDSALTATFGPTAKGFLVFNGTAANVLGLSAVVRPHQGVICANESHLNVDECGAPERWLGAKLFLVPTQEGKITVAEASKFLIRRGDQHFSQAAVVSLTQPTELGTVYSLDELREFSTFCRANGLLLHIDGARLANAAHTLGVTLKQMTTDVGVDLLSLGGTKNGMLLGEAVVFLNPKIGEDFKFIRKQGMQLASKQRYLAAPFTEYLKTDLSSQIASHVCGLAKLLERSLEGIPGVEILAPVQSNAVFVRIPQTWNRPLREKFFFYVWNEFENSVRWMLTWDHTEADVLEFVAAIKALAR